MPFAAKGSLAIPPGATIEPLPNPKEFPGQRWAQWSGNFFEHAPKSGDITQGAIGDCYLMAAINAILVRADGSEVIQRMVKDEGTHAVLHMFKNDAWHFVRVEKTLPYDRFGFARHNRGAKWVQLFEKAYAGFALDGTYSKLGSGGHPYAALQTFLGTASQVHAVPIGDKSAVLHML